MSFTKTTPDTLERLRQILIHELEIDGEKVNIYNQKFKIPTYDDMFICLQEDPSKILSSRNIATEDSTTHEFNETQYLNIQEHITIMLFSRNLEALQRKEEVVMSLYSIYSQQQQEEYSFTIARIAPIENLSVLEASALLYRYDIPVTILSWQKKVKTTEYFDSYAVKVQLNDGVPLIEETFDQPLTDITE